MIFLFLFAFFVNLHFSEAESLPPITGYSLCVKELNGDEWRANVKHFEQLVLQDSAQSQPEKSSEQTTSQLAQASTTPSQPEKASLSLCLADFYAGLLDGPAVGHMDLYKAFYHYHYAATHAHPPAPQPAQRPSLASPFSPALDTDLNTAPSPVAGQARAQAMIAFLMTLHPEVAPSPYSKQGDSVFNITVNEPASILYSQFAALGGSEDAQLAQAYRLAQGRDSDCSKAFDLYKTVAYRQIMDAAWRPTIELKSNAVHLSDEYESGKNTLENERDIISLSAYSADNGNVDGQIAMGTIYLEGSAGIPRDANKAFQYFLMAAEQEEEDEEPLAYLYLAHCYFKGYGTAQDNATGLTYLEAAAAADVPEAHTQMGLMHLNGWNTPVNLNEAVRHFEMAAKHNEQWALFELGRLSLSGQGPIARNAANALKYFQKAAQGGHLPSLYNLAMLSFSGVGVNANCPLAVQYMQEIVERTILRRANYRAYKKFLDGNYENALILYELTASQGSLLGQENAAWMHENNLGSSTLTQIRPLPYKVQLNSPKKELVLLPPGQEEARVFPACNGENNAATSQQQQPAQQDAGESGATVTTSSAVNTSHYNIHERKAFYFYQLAAGKLSAKAYLKIGDYLYYGRSQPVNYELAASAYSMAANLKSAQAAFNLGIMHHFGYGLKKDLHLAKRHYDRAAEISPEAIIPSTLAVGLIQLDWTVSQFMSPDGEILIMGLHWDTFLIVFFSSALILALGVKRFLQTQQQQQQQQQQ